MRRAVLAALLLSLVAPLSIAPGSAQPAAPAAPKRPVLFKADELTYGRNQDVLIARGNVEIVQGERILRADEVTYNRKTDRADARGHVTLLGPTGDVVFADRIEVSGDLKDGVAEGIRMRLADNARIAAAGGRRLGGVRTEMVKAVYSPCPLCRDDPTRPPTWQLKAASVVHDSVEHEVVYHDVSLEMWGVPVLYSPYFSHPDPSVKRKSGFLIPTVGRDSELGLTARIPYYLVIAPDKDATIMPIVTGKEGVVGVGEYRQRFVGGLFDGGGSLTHARNDTGVETFRGHFDGKIAYDIDDTWRTGAHIRYASDDTYLGRYDFSSDKTLTSNAFLEGFRGRNYFAANAYRFQGLRVTDQQSTTPLVIPEVDYSFFGAPDRLGGRTSVDANLRVLERQQGANSVRLSLDSGWELPYATAGGQLLSFFARLQSDGYWVENVPDPDQAGTLQSGLAGRLFPQVGIDWRYPFIRRGRSFTEVIEPIAGIIAAPNGSNPEKVPNEDSLDQELDDTNIFDRSRFTGLDVVENGQRVYYGLQTGLFAGEDVSAGAFVGQSYKLSGSDLFSSGTGLEDSLSDVVGRVRLDAGSLARLLYRFRFDHADLAINRSEVELAVGPRYLRLEGDYLFVKGRQAPEEFPDREETTVGLSSLIADSWRLQASTRYDLLAGRSLWHRVGVGYEDDCFMASLSFTRTFTEDRDIRPTDAVFLQVSFKTLGSIAGKQTLRSGPSSQPSAQPSSPPAAPQPSSSP